MFGLNLFKSTKTKKIAQSKKKTSIQKSPSKKTTTNKSIEHSPTKKSTIEKKTYRKTTKK